MSLDSKTRPANSRTGPSEAAASSAQAAAVEEPQPATPIYHSGAQLWLHRLSVLLFVFVCATAGVLLVVLPWRPEWLDNRLLLRYPGLRTIVSHAFVRGVCSGLGLLDIWIGFWEAIHYHEDKRS